MEECLDRLDVVVIVVQAQPVSLEVPFPSMLVCLARATGNDAPVVAALT
ncbi:hypothetical protein Vi05172_g5101 [Venturia inaequalis]|nr:hypothetical protein Vi05172_g5101 [Venturia inaequalis]